MTGKEKSGKANLPTIALSKEPTSAAEMLGQGEEAARLLDSPVYNLAHRSVIQSLQDEWMMTEPREREKREGLYQRIRALSMISSELAMMVEQARMIGDSELARERKLQFTYDENTGFPGHEGVANG